MKTGLASESNSRTDQMHSTKVGSFCFGYKSSKLERESQPKIQCFTSHESLTSQESWMTLGLPAQTPFWCNRMNIQVEMKWAMRGALHNFWMHSNTFYSGVSNQDVDTESSDERQEFCENMPCSPLLSPWSPFLPVTKWRKTHWDRKDHPLIGCNAPVHLSWGRMQTENVIALGARQTLPGGKSTLRRSELTSKEPLFPVAIQET